jgi:NADPH:quinone reductase-like Zn-dependent oxidoreductase
MKAIQFEAFGSPGDVVRCVDLPDPGEPGDGEILIAVEATPINPSDLLTLAGLYPVTPTLPGTPGNEGVGRVIAVGPKVTTVKVGDRVTLPFGGGTWREKIKCRAGAVFVVPEGADPLQLSMATVNPTSAYLMLNHESKLEPGDWVIQNAANSAVGQYIIHFAKAQGLKTMNVVRREELRKPLEAIGADAVVLDSDDLSKKARTMTGGGRRRLAIDAIAGAETMRLAGCLDRGGLVVTYGALSGQPCQMSSLQMIFDEMRLQGFWIVTWMKYAPPGAWQDLMKQVIGMLSKGEMTVEVEATYSFDRIKEAVEHAGRPGRRGKILLTGPALQGKA